MHSTVGDFVQRMLADPARVAPSSVHYVLEIGAKNINGSIRDLFPNVAGFIGIDLQEGPDVDIVADGATYQPPTSVDLVVTCECLEHASDPRGIVRNAYTMLMPGGVFLATAATHPRMQHSGVTGLFGVLEPGEVYANVDPLDLERWLRGAGFVDVYVEVDRGIGDVRAYARKATA